MILLPPGSPRTDTLFPYTTLFRSERLERGHVDDLGADAFAGELLRGFQRLLDLRAPGDQGQVGAVAQHVADIQRQRLAVVGDHFLLLAVDALGLHEDYRIRVADRGQQQAVERKSTRLNSSN